MKPTHFLVMLAMISMLFSSCSREDMDKMVADVKEKAGDLKSTTDDAVAKAKSVAQSAGDMSAVTDFTGKASMQLDSPTEFAASFIRLIPMGSDQAVLQIKSYQDDSSESFPSYLIQGTVNARSLDSLVGKSVACRVFAQKKNDGDVWSNLQSDPAMVTVKKIGENYSAEFKDAQLINSASNSKIRASGNFDCVEF